MKAKLICYDLSHLDQIKKVEVKRALFGYVEYSNNSRYTYQRKGILEDIPHKRPIKAVVIVSKGNEKKVIKVLNKFEAKYHLFDIEIKKSLLA